MPVLEATATGTPENRVDQDAVQQLAGSLLGAEAPEHLDLLSVFESAGIQQRAFAREFGWYLDSPGWDDRAEVYEEEGTELAADVTRACLDQADLPASAIDGVVFVNTTGLATPSLETHLSNRLGMRPSIKRVPVWGLGCAGGVAGLSRAADLARAHPDERFLVVALELCSLAFLRNELSRKLIVAAALFGDGAAGALVAGDELEAEGPQVRASASHLWPQTPDVMGWDVKDAGLDVVFSPEIPDIVRERLGEVVSSFLKENGGRIEDARAAFHPGGPKVLEAYEDALGLEDGKLAIARQTLREHGNMSSPTALFVLDRVLDEGLAPGEDALAAAVGPGFAAELALVTGA